ncbi:MAG TPA: alpha/beta fold hydrolase [Jiangellaceae bacterium]
MKAANWLSHLDYDWQSAVWRHWLVELSRRFTLLRYDERGCGLSDWEVPRSSFEAWVEDLEVVVDAAGFDTFPLLGISQGAPVAVGRLSAARGHRRQMMPRSRAMCTASVRELACSLLKIADT